MPSELEQARDRLEDRKRTVVETLIESQDATAAVRVFSGSDIEADEATEVAKKACAPAVLALAEGVTTLPSILISIWMDGMLCGIELRKIQEENGH